MILLKILGAAVLAASCLTWNGYLIKSPTLGDDAEFPGSSLKWIHIAEGEWKRRNLDIEKYRVSVVDEKESVSVILTGLNEPKNGFGSAGPDLGYEVEISKQDRKILHSNYVR